MEAREPLMGYRGGSDLLEERVVLVTGAGDGIGRAVALGCAAHGATVVLLGRTITKLETVYDAIESQGSPRPAIYPMNLEGASPKDYDDLAETIERELGRLDGLVHCAAELGTLTPLEHYELDTWTSVMQVNLHAPFLLTRACLPLLRQAPAASVVFSSSAVGRRGRAYWGAYAISNAALEGMMQVLADELEENTLVRVNSLDPGAVRTALRAKAYPAEDLDRHPSPEAVVPAYLYLLGEDSLTVTGRSLDAQ